MKSIIIKMALICMLLVLPQEAIAAPSGLVSSEPLAPGVVQEIYDWSTKSGNVHIGVWRCDLNNPSLDMRLVAGAGSYTKRATVSQMSDRTGSVAMVNGDYFNMALQGSPIGPSIIDGRLESSPANIIGLYSLGIDQHRVAHIEPIIFSGKITAGNGASFPIDGLNKTYYWHDPSGQESHTDTIQMYNDFWTSASRGHQTNTEILVNGSGIVEAISWGKNLPYPVPTGKMIFQVNGQGEAFIKNHVSVGSSIKVDIGLLPNRNWTFMVGGHALVLKDGDIQNYTKDINVLGGVRARTGAAISKDGKTIWIVAAEGRTYRSAGLSLTNLGYFMQQLGADVGLNLDGGGSTAMVTTPLGSFYKTVTIQPERNGAQRAVVNGIGIFNTAPDGPVVGAKIDGPRTMVVGETGEFKIAGAWDANYHPKNLAGTPYKLVDSNGLGAWDGPWFMPLTPGWTNAQVFSNNQLLGEKAIEVKGAEDISRIWLERSHYIATPDAPVTFTVRAKTTDNRTVQLSPKVLDWRVDGFSGEISKDAGTFTLADYNDLPNAEVHARLGDKEAVTYIGNPAYQSVDLYINQIQFWVDGQKKNIDQPPIIRDSRTFVPIRFVAEIYGGTVEWDNDERLVQIHYKDKHMSMGINDSMAVVDGEKVPFDAPPFIHNGRTMVPLRFISEQLGMRVHYDGQKQCVQISAKR